MICANQERPTALNTTNHLEPCSADDVSWSWDVISEAGSLIVKVNFVETQDICCSNCTVSDTGH